MADLDNALQMFARSGEEKATREKSQSLSLPYVNLVGYPFTPDVLTVIPKEEATKYRVIAFFKLNNDVRVATDDPANPALIPALKQLAVATRAKFYLHLCSKTSLDYALSQLEFVKEAPKTLERHVISSGGLRSKFDDTTSLSLIGQRILETPVTEILDMAFGGAIRVDASDIHIEPIEDGARIRFRIDGILQDIVQVPHESYTAIRNRIKYLAKLKLNVADQPQDGRFDIQIDEQLVDVRVSLMPGAWGEVIVLRLLNPSGAIISLVELGFRPDILKMVEEAIAKPNGAIFNTGPTGSGKTTTLYAILQQLNKPEVKIVTLEDPIEYRIDGIDQSQIKPDAGFDFASGLKHALRQDPDVIMVGEIRDKETAETALQASLTGHLVLTTLHTNSAPSSIPRLLDMGVKPFLLSGSINLIIAQRLVRKTCPSCHGGAAMPTCSVCKGTGFKGRVAIAEAMKITPKIEQLIQESASVTDYEKAAREDGMITMYADGLQKVRDGLTTEEEVKRVALESY